jgi:hypothetical protein
MLSLPQLLFRELPSTKIRVMWLKIMVVGLTGHGSKNDCAGKGQRKFTLPQNLITADLDRTKLYSTPHDETNLGNLHQSMSRSVLVLNNLDSLKTSMPEVHLSNI